MTRIALLSIVMFLFSDSHAWLYPEHRWIAKLAIERLAPEDRKLLQMFWSMARKGHEDRLSPFCLDSTTLSGSTFMDLSSWPAIAGDHSCSPADMLDIILDSDWIIKVDRIATRLEDDLHNAKRKDQTVNAIRNSDIRLQRADPEYVTRAGSNKVHFLTVRSAVDQSAEEYFKECLASGVPLNGVGAYSYFHSLAMHGIAQARSTANDQEAGEIMLAALANECFALHFLQDAFASGHIAGTWGNAAHRKGTHDHYNVAGLEAETWSNERLVLTGDAYMRDVDAEVAAHVVKKSLEQFLDAYEQAGSTRPDAPSIEFMSPDPFDVCLNNEMPISTYDMSLLEEVLLLTPKPALGEGLGELPRFRTEMGPFIGVSSSLGVSWLEGGFGPGQLETGAIGSIDANIVFGLGLDGVLNKAGDGLAFVQFGWRQDSPTSSQFTDPTSNFQSTTVTATIPGRSAYNIRFRMPFWLIPGDLLITAPILSWASPKAFQKMAVAAGNGGVIPWQSGISTPVGRFQFVLGREVGVSLYGLQRLTESVIVPSLTSNDVYVIGYKSTKWDFPFLEYQPTRTFSNTQTAVLKLQFSFGVDVPSNETTLNSEVDRELKLEEVWYLGFRLDFSWRRYIN